jgi:hypothetical protein
MAFDVLPDGAASMTKISPQGCGASVFTTSSLNPTRLLENESLAVGRDGEHLPVVTT